jgi:uncharacterized protein (DUF58 family)
MVSEEVKKKISSIKIRTRQAMSGTMFGDYSTAVKGSGMEFNQLHDYEEDDDVRFIDWNSSARTGRLLVRQYLEERNRTIIIAVDISASTFFSSTLNLKQDSISQVAAILALVSDYGKDNVGLLLFSDKVHEFIPPGRGHLHVTTILQKLFSQKYSETTTSLSEALVFIGKNIRRGSLVFLISDFIDEASFEKQLMVVSKRVSLVAVRCLDAHENSFPNVGLIKAKDLESKQEMLLDSSNNLVIQKYLEERVVVQNRLFRKCKVELLEIKHNQNYISSVIKFFKKRMLY